MGETQSDRAEGRRRAAELRLDQLAALRIRLASGEKLTPEDLDAATHRLADAQQRAARADVSSRLAHHEAAAAHQKAASANEGAGLTSKAQEHRAAAARDLEAGGEQAG